LNGKKKNFNKIFRRKNQKVNEKSSKKKGVNFYFQRDQNKKYFSKRHKTVPLQWERVNIGPESPNSVKIFFYSPFFERLAFLQVFH